MKKIKCSHENIITTTSSSTNRERLLCHDCEHTFTEDPLIIRSILHTQELEDHDKEKSL